MSRIARRDKTRANGELMTETVRRARVRVKARAARDRTVSSRVTGITVRDLVRGHPAVRVPAADVPAVPAAPDSAAAVCRATA